LKEWGVCDGKREERERKKLKKLSKKMESESIRKKERQISDDRKDWEEEKLGESPPRGLRARSRGRTSKKKVCRRNPQEKEVEEEEFNESKSETDPDWDQDWITLPSCECEEDCQILTVEEIKDWRRKSFLELHNPKDTVHSDEEREGKRELESESDQEESGREVDGEEVEIIEKREKEECSEEEERYFGKHTKT
jgi:hypothetical protein